LDTISSWHKKGIISAPKCNNSTLKAFKLEVISWLLDSWDVSIFNQVIPNELSWSGHGLGKGRVPYAIEFGCLIRRNLVPSDEKETGYEVLSPVQDRVSGRSSIRVNSALGRRNPPPNELFKLF
jgi:hypothetical protein